MSKLTLNIDDAVVAKAKRYAKSRRVSVSKLVEGYLDLVSKSFQTPADTPVLRSLRGTLKKANVRAYKRYLDASTDEADSSRRQRCPRRLAGSRASRGRLKPRLRCF